jgi:hypothetical protein
MSFKTLLVIKAVVCLVFGPILLLAPRMLFEFLGATLGPAGSFTAREYGAALVGTLLLTWLARNAVESLARRAILADLCIYDAIGFAVTVRGVLRGLLNPFGWGIALVYLFFTLGAGYLLLRKPVAAATPA